MKYCIFKRQYFDVGSLTVYQYFSGSKLYAIFLIVEETLFTRVYYSHAAVDEILRHKFSRGSWEDKVIKIDIEQLTVNISCNPATSTSLGNSFHYVEHYCSVLR